MVIKLAFYNSTHHAYKEHPTWLNWIAFKNYSGWQLCSLSDVVVNEQLISHWPRPFQSISKLKLNLKAQQNPETDGTFAHRWRVRKNTRCYSRYWYQCKWTYLYMNELYVETLNSAQGNSLVSVQTLVFLSVQETQYHHIKEHGISLTIIFFL